MKWTGPVTGVVAAAVALGVAEVVSIGAGRDWLAPVSSTILDGVRNITLPTGHSGLLVDGEVADLVGDLLRAPDAPESPSPG